MSERSKTAAKSKDDPPKPASSNEKSTHNGHSSDRYISFIESKAAAKEFNAAYQDLKKNGDKSDKEIITAQEDKIRAAHALPKEVEKWKPDFKYEFATAVDKARPKGKPLFSMKETMFPSQLRND